MTNNNSQKTTKIYEMRQVAKASYNIRVKDSEYISNRYIRTDPVGYNNKTIKAGFAVATYTNKKTGEIVVSFAGTEDFIGADGAADLKEVGFGLTPSDGQIDQLNVLRDAGDLLGYYQLLATSDIDYLKTTNILRSNHAG